MEDNRKKSGIKPGIIILVVLCVITLCGGTAFGMYYVMEKKASSGKNAVVQNDVNGTGIIITEDSRISSSDIAQKVSDGMIVVKTTGEWTFNSDCTESNAYLANSDKNNYPLKFEVAMSDTGKVILTTPEVPVGSCIQNFGLPEKLAAGTYEVVVSHQAVKDGQVFSTVRTSGKIIVR